MLLLPKLIITPIIIYVKYASICKVKDITLKLGLKRFKLVLVSSRFDESRARAMMEMIFTWLISGVKVANVSMYGGCDVYMV